MSRSSTAHGAATHEEALHTIWKGLTAGLLAPSNPHPYHPSRRAVRPFMPSLEPLHEWLHYVLHWSGTSFLTRTGVVVALVPAIVQISVAFWPTNLSSCCPCDNHSTSFALVSTIRQCLARMTVSRRKTTLLHQFRAHQVVRSCSCSHYNFPYYQNKLLPATLIAAKYDLLYHFPNCSPHHLHS